MGDGCGTETRRRRLLRWWYLCLGVGFALLAARSWIAGAGFWGVALRLLIAAGFLVLGLGASQRVRER